jgi:arylformamidase
MLPTKRVWDISPPVHAGSPVFPGDTPFQSRWALKIAADCPVNVQAITLSPHVGAHADAPLHYDAAGEPIGMLELTPYLGRCRVIHAVGCGPFVEWRHVARAVHGDVPPRVLVRTYQRMPEQWHPAFTAFRAQTLEGLADAGVQLVGIDSASIDRADCKTLPSHKVALRRNLRILENLMLDEVAEGDYELIALPLKLMCSDASPVRAVLRQL